MIHTTTPTIARPATRPMTDVAQNSIRTRGLNLWYGSFQALKNVSVNEHFFEGDFPQRPVMPGVLMLEALAQAAALLTFETLDLKPDDRTVYYFAGIDGARFKRPVEPGDQLFLDVEVLRMKANIWKFQARAQVGEELAVEAELMLAMRKLD